MDSTTPLYGPLNSLTMSSSSPSTPKSTPNGTPMMKAVIWSGDPYHMSVQSIPRPTLKAPTDALVRVTTASICGSDLHTYHGILGGSDVPYPMGHEAMGIVAEVGTQVKNFKVGDRVVIFGGNFYILPGAPEDFIYGFRNFLGQGTDVGGCQSEWPLSLKSIHILWVVRKSEANRNHVAEYVAVPDADDFLIKVPDGKEKELDYLLLSDIFPTGWQSITRTGFQPGDTVVSLVDMKFLLFAQIRQGRVRCGPGRPTCCILCLTTQCKQGLFHRSRRGTFGTC